MLGILLQGAEAAGLSLWASLQLERDLERARQPLRLGLGGAGAVAARASTLAALAPAASAPAARWLARRSAAYLVLTPALAGHASIQSPVWVFFPVDVLHVLAASVWVGGIACIVFALPLATRALEPAAADRRCSSRCSAASRRSRSPRWS